jgi:hypothetical protein
LDRRSILKLSIEQKRKLDKLVDIRDINIDQNKDIDEKIKSFINQIGNPYNFRYKNIMVSIEFVGDQSLEDILIEYLSNHIAI